MNNRSLVKRTIEYKASICSDSRVVCVNGVRVVGKE